MGAQNSRWHVEVGWWEAKRQWSRWNWGNHQAITTMKTSNATLLNSTLKPSPPFHGLVLAACGQLDAPLEKIAAWQTWTAVAVGPMNYIGVLAIMNGSTS